MLVQGALLFGSKGPRLSDRETSKSQGPHTHTDEAPDRKAQNEKTSANLPLLPLYEGER